MLTDDELQSRTIAFLRFPLIVGVVLIHAYFSDLTISGTKLLDIETLPLTFNVSYFFSQILSRIAVPLFYFISGFLFFYKTNEFNGNVYLAKLKKRARSLLVPYIFWNLLMLLFYWGVQTFLPGLMSGRNKLVADYTVTDWLWAFWDKDMINVADGFHMPFNFPLWFIRDLMVVVCLSPLLYVWIKRLKHYGIAILGVLWLTNCWPSIVGLSINAFFFFAAGAWFSINRRNFVTAMRPCLSWSLPLYALIAVVLLYFKDAVAWTGYLHQCGILVGMVGAISLSACCLDKGWWHVNRFLAGSSFFIYAFHAMPLAFTVKAMFKVFQPHADVVILALYFLCPALTIAVGLLVYYVLKRWCPVLLVPMTGGR